MVDAPDKTSALYVFGKFITAASGSGHTEEDNFTFEQFKKAIVGTDTANAPDNTLLETVFNAIDLDGNDTITSYEADTMVRVFRTVAFQMDGVFQANLEKYDENDDGLMSLDEAKKVILDENVLGEASGKGFLAEKGNVAALTNVFKIIGGEDSKISSTEGEQARMSSKYDNNKEVANEYLNPYDEEGNPNPKYTPKVTGGTYDSSDYAPDGSEVPNKTTTKADFITAVTGTGGTGTSTVDPAKLAIYIKSMGLTTDDTKAKTLADTLLATQGGTTLTADALYEKLNKLHGHEPLQSLDVIDSIFTTGSGQDLTYNKAAFVTFMNNTDETVRNGWLKAVLTNQGKLTGEKLNSKLKELKGMTPEEIATAFFGTGPTTPYTAFETNVKTFADAAASGSGNVPTKTTTKADFITAVTATGGTGTSTVDPAKLATYIVSMGITTDNAKATTLANTMLATQGGTTLTADALYDKLNKLHGHEPLQSIDIIDGIFATGANESLVYTKTAFIDFLKNADVTVRNGFLKAVLTNQGQLTGNALNAKLDELIALTPEQIAEKLLGTGPTTTYADFKTKTKAFADADIEEASGVPNVKTSRADFITAVTAQGGTGTSAVDAGKLAAYIVSMGITADSAKARTLATTLLATQGATTADALYDKLKGLHGHEPIESIDIIDGIFATGSGESLVYKRTAFVDFLKNADVAVRNGFLKEVLKNQGELTGTALETKFDELIALTPEKIAEKLLGTTDTTPYATFKTNTKAFATAAAP